MTISSEQRRAIEYCTGVPVDTYGWEIKDIIPIPNSSEQIAYIKHEATGIYFHVPLSEIIIGEKEAA